MKQHLSTFGHVVCPSIDRGDQVWIGSFGNANGRSGDRDGAFEFGQFRFALGPAGEVAEKNMLGRMPGVGPQSNVGPPSRDSQLTTRRTNDALDEETFSPTAVASNNETVSSTAVSGCRRTRFGKLGILAQDWHSSATPSLQHRSPAQHSARSCHLSSAVLCLPCSVSCRGCL